MNLLAADDLTVHRADGTALLRDVSVTVERGETVVVAGRSGSGKTMLTKALGGLLEDRSNLTVSGTLDVTEEIGFLFQNPKTQLVRRSVEHDVAFGLENQAIPRAEMTDRVQTWAERLDATHLLGRDIEHLSRGESAIVALLGSLVTEPDLVLLDEPLAPLDHRNRRLVLDAIETLQSHGTALLIAEHDLRDILGNTDRMLVLDAGQIVASGPPSSLLETVRDRGITLPFATRVALERGTDPPLSTEGHR